MCKYVKLHVRGVPRSMCGVHQRVMVHMHVGKFFDNARASASGHSKGVHGNETAPVPYQLTAVALKVRLRQRSKSTTVYDLTVVQVTLELSELAALRSRKSAGMFGRAELHGHLEPHCADTICRHRALRNPRSSHVQNHWTGSKEWTKLICNQRLLASTHALESVSPVKDKSTQSLHYLTSTSRKAEFV
jgi:hypothetical protein